MVKTLSNKYSNTAWFQIPVSLEQWKKACFRWASQYAPLTFLDSNEYPSDKHRRFEALLAVGTDEIFQLETTKDSFEKLKTWYNSDPWWAFGYFSYDLKNDTEKLESNNPDATGFPVLYFYRPQFVIEIHQKEVFIHSRTGNPESVYQEILRNIDRSEEEQNTTTNGQKLQARISRAEYLETIDKIQEHIRAGDLYEMNFCQEFFLENIQIEPQALFQNLNQLSKAPFSAFLRLEDQYLISASPERFLQKSGKQLISQPIKGTIKRSEDAVEDQEHRKQLFNSIKDRAEHVMIVDLVRNDLARSSQPGSVKVEELYGIYSFEHVHHMISTISSELRSDVHPLDALKAAFPMGSMTGAPKVMSMELIEHFEKSRRGLYSGACGYITPKGDFDFNVVIRSMLYRSDTRYLSFQVGGAIVYDSNPQSEYEECLLKAKGMLAVLGLQETGSTSNPSRRRSSQNAE